MHPKSPTFARQKHCKVAGLGKGTVCGHDTEFSLNEDKWATQTHKYCAPDAWNKPLVGSGRHKVVEKREKGPIFSFLSH